jgi:hypothetical protein
MDIETTKQCKLCNNQKMYGRKYKNNYNINMNIIDVCDLCCDFMKYLEDDLINNGIKFIRKLRCNCCNFRICNIMNNPICLWCLKESDILKHNILYGKYKWKSHAYVLYNDFNYCINQIEFRTENNYKDSKLTILTKKILNLYRNNS